MQYIRMHNTTLILQAFKLQDLNLLHQLRKETFGLNVLVEVLGASFDHLGK